VFLWFYGYHCQCILLLYIYIIELRLSRWHYYPFLDAIKYHYNCHISNIISRGNLVLHLSGIRIIYRHMITFRFTWYFEIDEIYISIQIGQHMHHITRQKIWIPQLCPVHSIIKVALEIHNYLWLLIFVDIFMWIIYIKYR
jgi:hypothetical protein